MVCSIGQPYSKLIKYAEENFITKDEAIANSRWFGSGAEKLGLSGKVNPSSYENAYQGKDDSGNFLRRQLTNKNSRPGRDLTCSAPKSVSLLALVEEKKQLILFHDRAVNRALEYVEQNCIYTRTGQGGSNLQQTNNMVTSVFQHHDSRNLDPNLHSHCVIFNQTQGKDGKWRSMDNRELYQQRITIGMVYHHELSQQLMEQGYSINWNRDGTFDIANMEREQLEQFSSRRTEIINVAGANASSKEKAIACLSTRNTKQYISSADRKLLKDSWNLKYQQANLKPEVELKKANSPKELKRERTVLTRKLIDNSIESIGKKKKNSFTSAELLKESLIKSQGQHSLKAIQQEIKDHPSLLPAENNALTTIDLYRKNKTNRNRLETPESKSDVLKLATNALSSQENLTAHQNELSQEESSKNRFILKDIPDQEQRISQSIDDYLQKSRNPSQSQSIILTDNENDKEILTTKVRQKLISENILSDKGIRSLILNPKNLNSQSITKIENYQPGNAVKFNRSSKKFSNQHLYKILSVDEKNNVVQLGDRFGNRVDLPMNRYKNREVFKVERRELRINEKLRFERGQYINGKQIPSGQLFTIEEIRDKQKITIKSNNKQSVVKSNDLFFARYNYVDTLEKYQGNKIDSCIYYPSETKSQQLFRKDIYEVAHLTKVELTVCSSDDFIKSSPAIKASLEPQKMEFNNQSQSQPIDIDNSLFELASSSKYIAQEQDLDGLKNVQVYHSPDGVMIEKDPQNLSIYYDGKTVEFDQDFNVTNNEFKDREIHQLNKKTQSIKKELIEHNRTKQIIKDIDVDISR